MNYMDAVQDPRVRRFLGEPFSFWSYCFVDCYDTDVDLTVPPRDADTRMHVYGGKGQACGNPWAGAVVEAKRLTEANGDGSRNFVYSKHGWPHVLSVSRMATYGWQTHALRDISLHAPLFGCFYYWKMGNVWRGGTPTDIYNDMPPDTPDRAEWWFERQLDKDFFNNFMFFVIGLNEMACDRLAEGMSSWTNRQLVQDGECYLVSAMSSMGFARLIQENCYNYREDQKHPDIDVGVL